MIQSNSWNPASQKSAKIRGLYWSGNFNGQKQKEQNKNWGIPLWSRRPGPRPRTQSRREEVAECWEKRPGAEERRTKVGEYFLLWPFPLKKHWSPENWAHSHKVRENGNKKYKEGNWGGKGCFFQMSGATKLFPGPNSLCWCIFPSFEKNCPPFLWKERPIPSLFSTAPNKFIQKIHIMPKRRWVGPDVWLGWLCPTGNVRDFPLPPNFPKMGFQK